MAYVTPFAVFYSVGELNEGATLRNLETVYMNLRSAPPGHFSKFILKAMRERWDEVVFSAELSRYTDELDAHSLVELVRCFRIPATEFVAKHGAAFLEAYRLSPETLEFKAGRDWPHLNGYSLIFMEQIFEFIKKIDAARQAY
jgi:hypothetical protein